jgi:hypothetical protein
VGEGGWLKKRDLCGQSLLQSRQAVFGACLFERREQCRQALADEIRVAAGADKVSVAVPARDNMNMQMLGQPSAGTFADVYTDVKAVRLYRKGQHLLGIPYQFGHLKKFFIGCCIKIRDVPDGGDKQVPIVIGKQIEHSDTVFGSPKDKIFVVILRRFDVFANEALVLVGKTLYVPDSPRRPEIFVFQHYKNPIVHR